MIEILTDIHIYAAAAKPFIKWSAFFIGTLITTHMLVQAIKK